MFGAGIGASVGMYIPSIIKYMGMRWLAQTVGLNGFMNSLSFLITGPLFGKGRFPQVEYNTVGPQYTKLLCTFVSPVFIC